MVSKNVKKILGKLHIPTWLFVLLVIVFALRIPSFFEPYSYGDEMIYLTLGEAVRQQIPLYKGIHDNKPPLLYITAALAGSLFWFKAILAIWHLATVFVFWKLAGALFSKNKKLQVIATIIFALATTLPPLEGNIANAELFMIGPIILTFYILLTKKLNFKNIFGAGMLFSTAILFKVPAVFDIPTIIIFWVLTQKLSFKNLKTTFKNSAILFLGLLTPIAATLLYYHFRSALWEYMAAAFLQNVGYLSSWRPGDVREPFLVRNAPLLTRAGIVAFGLLVLFIKRNKLSKQFVFLTTWLLLGLFATTLSERPYPHYLIQIVPPASLLLAMLFVKKNIEQVLVIIPLTLAAAVPVYFDFWKYPTLPYYQKFVNFATNRISKDEYFSTFGGQVLRNYEIAKIIISLTNKKDKIFVWGDSSAIYALSRRLPPGKYVADYHIKDFSSKEETFKTLLENEPKLIIILPDSPNFPALTDFLKRNYIQIDFVEDVEIWKPLKPTIRALIAL